MRVAQKRWGEITIKKQGDGKNRFSKTRSFSIEDTLHEYDIDQLKRMLEMVVNLTQKYEFKALMTKLSNKGE